MTYFRPSNLTKLYERSSAVFKVGSLDIDTDWTDELGAILDEELEECDHNGKNEGIQLLNVTCMENHFDDYQVP